MATESVDDLLDFPDLISWQTEAEAIIKDIQNHVREIGISTALPSSRTHIFLNMTTLENRRMCIRVSGAGFRVVGDNYDQQLPESELTTESYDTPYALLSVVSTEYTKSFGNLLTKALERLKE